MCQASLDSLGKLIYAGLMVSNIKTWVYRAVTSRPVVRLCALLARPYQWQIDEVIRKTGVFDQDDIDRPSQVRTTS